MSKIHTDIPVNECTVVTTTLCDTAVAFHWRGPLLVFSLCETIDSADGTGSERRVQHRLAFDPVDAVTIANQILTAAKREPVLTLEPDLTNVVRLTN